MWDMHHIISDAISQDIMVRDFIALYEEKEPAPLRIQYKDFSARQNHESERRRLKKQEDYWLNRYSGEIPRLNMPTDFPRPPVFNFEGEAYEYALGAADIEVYREIASRGDATLYMNMLTFFMVLLYKYTGREDIIVGTATAGRRHTDLENIVGLFVNMLTMRNRPVEDLSFLEFLNQVKRTTMDAYENQDYQFDELVGRLGIEPQAGRNPLFDTQFTFQNAADAVRNQETIEVADFRVTLVASPVKRQPFDLGVNVTETKDAYRFFLGYLTALFKRSTIEDMAKHYVDILHQCMENKTVKIKDILISLDLVTGKAELTREDVTAFEF